jgi:acetyl esterase/lipase
MKIAFLLALAGMCLAGSSPAPSILAYGPAPLQTLAFTPASKGGAPAPLVIFVHGGAWTEGSKENATGRFKAPHYTGEGYAFATLDYRLVPSVRVEDQAADVARAVAKLVHDAAKLGIDPGKMILMGHSAGAHLAALVGTDPSYLKAQGLDLSSLAGVVLLDGAAYDVPRQMAQAGRFMARKYDEAFGTDPVRQKAVSPVFHAEAPNVARFLILHIDRDDGTAQSQELAEALQKAGTSVRLEGFSDRGLLGHMRINRDLGDPSYPATPVVDDWLRQTFGK